MRRASRAAIGAVIVSAWALSSAAEAADAGMIAARQKFFGFENVNAATGRVARDKVIVSWLSNASFAAAIAGRVLLLDSYVTRLEVRPGRTPFVIKDLVDLAPEAILLGHGHFDHADNAAYIAARTKAVIYASEETCADMRADFAREAADPAIQRDPAAAFSRGAQIACKPVTTAGSVPATQVLKLSFLEPDACVIAFRHLHSVAVPVDPAWPRAPSPADFYAVDPRDAELFPAGTPLKPKGAPQPGQMDVATSGHRGQGGPVALFFDFVLRRGTHMTVAWNDSAGALKEGKGAGWDGVPADGERVLQLLERLPQTDVHLGTIATANFDNNLYRDPFAYIAALKPKLFLPLHLTTGTTFKEAVSMAVYAGYLDQLKRSGISAENWPKTRWLVDPTDYARPIVFDANDKAWDQREKTARIQQFCK